MHGMLAFVVTILLASSALVYEMLPSVARGLVLVASPWALEAPSVEMEVLIVLDLLLEMTIVGELI